MLCAFRRRVRRICCFKQTREEWKKKKFHSCLIFFRYRYFQTRTVFQIIFREKKKNANRMIVLFGRHIFSKEKKIVLIRKQNLNAVPFLRLTFIFDTWNIEFFEMCELWSHKWTSTKSKSKKKQTLNMFEFTFQWHRYHSRKWCDDWEKSRD